jgi:hypothetical protein
LKVETMERAERRVQNPITSSKSGQSLENEVEGLKFLAMLLLGMLGNLAALDWHSSVESRRRVF